MRAEYFNRRTIATWRAPSGSWFWQVKDYLYGTKDEDHGQAKTKAKALAAARKARDHESK